MNVQQYIQSGIIEDYCLGQLSPQEMESVAQNALLYHEIKLEIEAFENGLLSYASAFEAGIPNKKKELLALLDNLEAEEHITNDNIPSINKYSDADNWRRFIKPLLPDTLSGPFYVHDLPAKNGVEQFILWTHHPVPHETHTDEQETILLLEGECRCYINNEVFELRAGDFLSIPLHADHNVEILKGPVMAVIQRVKVA